MNGMTINLFIIDGDNPVGYSRIFQGRFKLQQTKGAFGIVAKKAPLHHGVNMNIGQSRGHKLVERIAYLSFNLPQIRTMAIGGHQQHSLDMVISDMGKDSGSPLGVSIPWITTSGFNAFGKRDWRSKDLEGSSGMLKRLEQPIELSLTQHASTRGIGWIRAVIATVQKDEVDITDVEIMITSRVLLAQSIGMVIPVFPEHLPHLPLEGWLVRISPIPAIIIPKVMIIPNGSHIHIGNQ